MQSSKYEILINVEGHDYNVIVDDLETANLLLNDHEAARQYINQYSSDSVLNVPLEPEIIWKKRKPSEEDVQATKLLLQLRLQYDKNFNDKKTSKNKLWQKIADGLREHNYHLGDNPGEKCRQKFSNLTKAYLTYVKHQTTTGTERNDDLPPFFDELHSLLSLKHKFHPKTLEDTLQENNKIDTEDEDGEESSASSSHTDRFKTCKRKVKPQSKSDMLVNELHADKKIRQEQFTALQEHMKKTEDQRERLLTILEKAFSN